MKTPIAAGVLVGVALIFLVGAAPEACAQADFTVAQDGSGDFTTVQAAIDAVPRRQHDRTRILIKPGTYQEEIVVPRNRPRITLIGENRDGTIITGNDYTLIRGDPRVTATCYVAARDFGARNLTFANTAGMVGQASYALWIAGSRAHFRNCAALGYQDTLYLPCANAYFKRCFIEGAVDFIYGEATAVFEECAIHCIGDGYIAAANMNSPRTYGFVFKSCTIYGTASQVYLGRALGAYANVVYDNCAMDDEIVPDGWDDLGDETRHDTAFFAEYNSTGDGADPADRVDWSRQLSADMETDYSLDKIFGLTPDSGANEGQSALVPWYADY